VKHRVVLVASLVSGALVLGVAAAVVLGPSGPAATAPGAQTTPGEQPASTPVGQVGEGRVGDPSPHRSGRAGTVAGAREAALAYVSASQQWLYLDDEAIGAAVRQVATPAGAERLVRRTVAEVAVARDALVHATGPVWWFVRPLATRVTLQGDRAQASVWVVTVLSAAGVALPQADWVTLELDLVWRDGRWLIEGVEDRPGPTPMSAVRDEPWQPEPFDEALRGFERIGSEQAR
jgi:hypothetical protein